MKTGLAVLALMLAFVLGGCDNRKCLESHTEMQWIPISQYDPNLKTTRVVMQWMPVTVCDQYEPEPNKKI